MELHKFLCLFLVFFTCFLSSSQAYKFYVGGKDGWVLHPSENYNHWAERNRFQVNDTLFFKYKKGSDSVLVVSKDDYYKCNRDKPIMKMEDGDSVFKFDKSGPFFFISGNNGSCEKGQRLIVIVLAVRHPKYPLPSSPYPSPFAKGPAPVGQNPAAAPPKGTTPVFPAPVVKPPVMPPAPAMSPKSPSPFMSPAPSILSPSPMTETPVPSPTTSPMSPYAAPTIAPVSPSPTTAPSISSPPEEASAPAPSSPVTATPTTAPTADNTPGSGNNPGDVKVPAPSPSSAPVVTPLSVLVSSVTLVLSVAIGSFINAP